MHLCAVKLSVLRSEHLQPRSQYLILESISLPSHTWRDLINVFEVFLPQLLLYPNPADPLNGEAAALLMREPQLYNQKVKGE
eukprot:1157704-Pelagomonas_calceolata.AAC.2